jgi:glycosyltransferase involved in cell wall biosynthesis
MTSAEPAPARCLITVVTCTRDRARSLERMLTSVEKLLIPATLCWEMIIVDNGSSDDTPAVVESFGGRLPIRRVFEPDPGLSNARNAGVAAAIGDYILWTDDDVEVEPGWLAAYLAAFERFPEAAVFGGRIVPRLEPPTPEWFSTNQNMLRGILAARDLGPECLSLTSAEDRIPYGANYAIRAREQKNFYYDPRLGVAPGRRRGDEEIDVITRILSAGNSGYWVPQACVIHIVAPGRQTEAYVRDYFLGLGETFAFRTLTKRARGRNWFLLSEGLRAAANAILYRACRAGGRFMPSRWWVGRLVAVAWHTGAFRYALGDFH